jgi:selenocysteine-specific translation elongation factor
LQLLSYDIHAEAYSAARDILKKPPNDEAKREALRLLAADAKATPIFEKVLLDKKELRENRQIAASALHALHPEKLQKQARKILLDKSDYDDIKATSLTALEQFGDGSFGQDKALLKSVDRLGAGKAPARYKQSARRFLTKYGP